MDDEKRYILFLALTSYLGIVENIKCDAGFIDSHECQLEKKKNEKNI